MLIYESDDFQGLAPPRRPGEGPRAWIRYWRHPVSLRHPMDEPRPGRFGSLVGRPARERARALINRAYRQRTPFGYFTLAELRAVRRGDRALTHRILVKATAYLDQRLREREAAADLASRPFRVSVENGVQLHRRGQESPS